MQCEAIHVRVVEYGFILPPKNRKKKYKKIFPGH